MTARFHAPGAREVGQIVALPRDEAEHLTRVMRLRAGDTIRVFDGSGLEFTALVERIGKSTADARLLEPHPSSTELGLRITLAQAILKGNKMDDVVRDAVMMGAVAIVPLLTDRSETTLAALERGQRRARWQRIVVASTKQCGRAVLASVAEPCSFATFLASLAPGPASAPEALMLVEPAAAEGAQALPTHRRPASGAVTLLTGPEGGWSAEEIARARDVIPMLTLRGPILRADAMPTVAIAALCAAWGEW